MYTAYLNIGSNQGDRHALIERAVALIRMAWPMAAVRLSDWYESAPWGYESPNGFVNLGVALDFAAHPAPLDMLHTLQLIERLVGTMPHRNADGTYRDRDIDIDIIAIDNLRIVSPTLTLPHPRAAQRDFVTVPLRQLLQYGEKDGREGSRDSVHDV